MYQLTVECVGQLLTKSPTPKTKQNKKQQHNNNTIAEKYQIHSMYHKQLFHFRSSTSFTRTVLGYLGVENNENDSWGDMSWIFHVGG